MTEYRRWEADEDLVVRHHYARLPLADLAAALGRTEAATRRRANLLGARKGPRPVAAPAARRPWTAAEDDEIRDWWGVRSAVAIARALGRSADAVRVRRKRLGVRGANVLTSREVARLLGVDSHLVTDWIEAKLLPAGRGGRRCGSGRYRMWSVGLEALERFVTSHPECYRRDRIEPGYWRDLAEHAWRADPLLTVPETARLHGVSAECVRKAIRDGRLAAVRGFGFNRPWYVRRSVAAGFRPLRPELVGHRGRGAGRSAA